MTLRSFYSISRLLTVILALILSLTTHLSAQEKPVTTADEFLELFAVDDQDLDRLIEVGEPPKEAITINFATDSAVIDGQRNREQLSQLAEALTSPKIKKNRAFSIEGHTDARGSSRHNFKLSQRRSEAVVDYLVKNFGVPRNQLAANGRGESELLDKADTAEAHAKNRRVEIILDGVID
ncbi:MAG: OmpA family protein [Verrucomicrobiota bacterium]